MDRFDRFIFIFIAFCLIVSNAFGATITIGTANKITTIKPTPILPYAISDLLYEPIIRINDQKYLQSNLGEYSISERENKLTIKLFDKFWSNGEPITSDDIIASFNFYKSDLTLTAELSPILSIEKIDDKTLIASISETSESQLLTFLTMQILPKNEIKNETYASLKFLKTTSGPYKIESITDTKILLTPVDTKVDTKSKLHSLAFENHPYDELWKLFNSKKINVIYDDPYHELKTDENNIKHLSETKTPVSGLWLNTQTPLFQNLEIRTQIGLALPITNQKLAGMDATRFNCLLSDYHGFMTSEERNVIEILGLSDKINPKIYSGNYSPPSAMEYTRVPADSCPFFSENCATNTIQPLLPLRLALENAGYNYNTHEKKFMRGADTAQIKILAPDTINSDTVLIEQLINMVKTLNEIGIPTQLDIVSDYTYNERLKYYDYDMVVATMPILTNPKYALNLYFGTDSALNNYGLNYANYRNESVDRIINSFNNPTINLGAAMHMISRIALMDGILIPFWQIQPPRAAFIDFKPKSNSIYPMDW